MAPVTTLLLAAGFGKRLGSITQNIPKPLVDIGGKTLIEHAIHNVKKAGISDVVVNLHHLGEKISDFLGDGSRMGIKIEYSKEDPILDTGGAIKRVLSKYPDKPILVYNSDAFFDTDLNINNFINSFIENKSAIAAMLLRKPPTPNPFGTIKVVKDGPSYRVVKILDSELKTKLDIPTEDFIFPGIHIFNPQVKKYMDTLGEIFCSVKDLYPLLLSNNEYVMGQIYDGYWNDAGTPERLAEVVAWNSK